MVISSNIHPCNVSIEEIQRMDSTYLRAAENTVSSMMVQVMIENGKNQNMVWVSDPVEVSICVFNIIGGKIVDQGRMKDAIILSFPALMPFNRDDKKLFERSRFGYNRILDKDNAPGYYEHVPTYYQRGMVVAVGLAHMLSGILDVKYTQEGSKITIPIPTSHISGREISYIDSALFGTKADKFPKWTHALSFLSLDATCSMTIHATKSVIDSLIAITSSFRIIYPEVSRYHLPITAKTIYNNLVDFIYVPDGWKEIPNETQSLSRCNVICDKI